MRGKSMNTDYLIVHKKILPEYLEKVIYARNLLERHEVPTVTEAVQKAGISRNTYYKYKKEITEEMNAYTPGRIQTVKRITAFFHAQIAL